MAERMAKLDRALQLVHLLSDSAEGLTLDEMASELSVNRRTAERLRDVIARHFDLEDVVDERHKRFRIRDSLRRVFTKPTAAEVAALQAEADARRLQGALRAQALDSLLAKVKGALDDREKRRLDPDLEALVRLQRMMVPAGPVLGATPETLAAVQGAILVGCCLEFDYRAEEASEPRWRRVIPYGLVHGPVTYLVGQMPTSDKPPVYYRLDRMQDVRASNLPGCAPDDWDLDAWINRSFGVWHEDAHDVVLRILPDAVDRARRWRFHPAQTVEERGGELIVRFRAGGLREIAEHLFTWGGDVVIEGPAALDEVMRERLALAMNATRANEGGKMAKESISI
ncbi:helix-turn-helix transcriptional regulator [Stakelama saccharophila]|uniref:WYL domain-containing protein n=1 Tax=Stakelama saccharophila TaxID=3075605 RepID=A0ABZ0B6Y7_9SPHN|nr:WYL domain-containing protein [Stakelama sp. W311]WNO53166.1 WYL domain-containing protein [Stakelama sp. W311]